MPNIEMYTVSLCPYCSAAKALLKQKNVDFTEIDVGRDHARRAEMLTRSGGRITVPQIFIGEQHVGGFDDLRALDQAGRLDLLLAA